jgi:hypothetical protein
MLETIMKLYVMAMANDVRSPLPHLFGPPGCGKSTVVEQLADLLGVNLHIMNVARLSPLDVEGVQMPGSMDDPSTARLHMLTATFWTQLKEGDIVLLDEFLRGFPEVYNALLDILTSRRVGAFRLPKVFIIGASNSTVSYDKALEDRLLHLTVPDPRSSKRAKKEQAEHLVTALGLMPEMVDSYEMQTLLDTEVLPMYDLLDQVKGKSSSNPGSLKGTSIRNLIGQGLLRQVQSAALRELIDMNNKRAASVGKLQYVVLVDGKAKSIPSNYESKAHQLMGNPRLSEKQATNLKLNLQLIEMESVRNQKGDDGDDLIDDLFEDE